MPLIFHLWTFREKLVSRLRTVNWANLILLIYHLDIFLNVICLFWNLLVNNLTAVNRKQLIIIWHTPGRHWKSRRVGKAADVGSCNPCMTAVHVGSCSPALSVHVDRYCIPYRTCSFQLTTIQEWDFVLITIWTDCSIVLPCHCLLCLQVLFLFVAIPRFN